MTSNYTGDKGAKRHRKTLRDNLKGVTNPAIRRLARRGGVKRISKLIYEEARTILKDHLATIVKDAIVYMEHGRRKTVNVKDVCYSLNRNGKKLYF